jgi:putative serine protease PepD
LYSAAPGPVGNTNPPPPVGNDPVAAYRRPPQVEGPFAPHVAPPTRGTQRPGVPEVVADAFGRPDDSADSLARPPLAAEIEVEPSVGDPWRDPSSGVVLGAPAAEAPAEARQDPPAAERFTMRQALFDHRLRPASLIMVVLVALLIGLAGGAIGAYLADRVNSAAVAPSVTLAPVESAVERPPGSVADIASRVTPAVVSIEVRTGDTGDTGSGFLIDGSGYILTNNHVISLAATDKDAQLTVVFNDANATRVKGTIVGRDPMSDLAVVKVSADNVTVARIGKASSLRVGDSVIAIGSPLGLAGTVTTGIVSALHRPVHLSGEGTDTDAVIDAIQTDASVNPGNSGGPLVDATGAVVGINTAIRTLGGDATGSSGSIGLGFAIPIDYAVGVARELIAGTKIQHPTIGVNARSATDGTTDGAEVQNVVDGGPADQAGVQEGDIIVKVGDRPVGSADELTVAVQEHAVGDRVPIELLRDGKRMTVTVTLAPVQG